MRCTAPSLFIHVTVPVVFIDAGLGVNDCAPPVVVMVMVTPAGVGSPPVDVGLVGLPPPPSPPHATDARATTRVALHPNEVSLHMFGSPCAWNGEEANQWRGCVA